MAVDWDLWWRWRWGMRMASLGMLFVSYNSSEVAMIVEVWNWLLWRLPNPPKRKSDKAKELALNEARHQEFTQQFTQCLNELSQEVAAFSGPVTKGSEIELK
ncbi:hypothetical protein Ancab_039092 [Ancistrocladus abbreviatus]